MTTTPAPATRSGRKFEIGVRVTNANGAWVELRPAITQPYKRTMYVAYAWASDFPADIAHTSIGPATTLAAVERGMRTWLRER